MAAVPPPLGALEPYAHGSQVVLCAKVFCSCGQPYVHKRDSGTGHGWCTIATCHRSYGRKRAKQGLRPKPMPRFVVDDCLRGGSQVQGQAASASAPHRDLPPPPPVPTGFWLPTPTFPPKPPMPRPPTPPLAPEAEPEPEAPDSSQAIVIADSSQARASLQRAQLEQVACAQEEARMRILESSRVAADMPVGEVVPDSRPGFERYDDDWSATQAWVQQHNMQVVNIEGQRMVLKLDQVAPRFFSSAPGASDPAAAADSATGSMLALAPTSKAAGPSPSSCAADSAAAEPQQRRQSRSPSGRRPSSSRPRSRSHHRRRRGRKNSSNSSRSHGKHRHSKKHRKGH